jgi:plasmid stabilization system protein ParE
MPSKKIIVEWSESASLDLKSIILHIATSSPKTPRMFLQELKKNAKFLKSFLI